MYKACDTAVSQKTGMTPLRVILACAKDRNDDGDHNDSNNQTGTSHVNSTYFVA